VSAFEKELSDGSMHPRDAKMKLAFEITSTYYSEADAEKGQSAFVSLFQKGDVPDEMPEFSLQEGQTVLDVILAGKLASSKSEARRLIDQKGVRLNGEVMERGDVPFPHTGVLQVGKRKFLRVK
jgi:tyrosyl-tRNA synthetase